jgi:outer membrane protein assembly factor BamB
MRLCPTVFIAAILAAGYTRAEQDWPQFRGPHGDGTSAARHVPLTWSESNNIAWKVAVLGRGRSSPVVMEDRVWLTTALEQGVIRTNIKSDDMQTAEHVTLQAVCLDAKQGKELWRTTLFEVDKPAPVHWFNSWATPSPAIEKGRLYCDFGTFGTACLDARDGKILWQTCLPLDHQVGPGSSPVLWRDLLVLVRDGRDAQYVAALDKRSGRIVWKTDRPPIDTSNRDLKKCFTTPLLIASGKGTQLLSPGARWVVSYDPDTGKELWRLRHGEGFSIGSCPVFSHGLAIFSTGCMKARFLAVDVDSAGEIPATNVAWRITQQVPVMSSPVIGGEEMYWVSDEGMASCADARTGEIHWQKRAGGRHFASPLYAEGRVYFFGQDGRSTVIRAGRQFEKLAENQIQGPVVATPAIVDGTIFLRTDSHLYRIQNDKP